MSNLKNSSLIIVVIAILAISAGLFTQHSHHAPKELPEFEKAVILPTSKAIQSDDFTDHTGKAFSIDSFKGYWNIVFFGFTNCPDICPTTMQTMATVKKELQDQNKWGNYRVIMVSVDPERDSIERLNNYVPYFDEEFIGLRGDIDTTTNFAKELGILFFKQEPVNDFYEVDHSASIILINPLAEMAGVITAPHEAKQISRDLTLLANHFNDNHSNSSHSHHVAQAANTTSNAENNKEMAVHDGHAMPNKASGKTIEGLVIEEAWIRPAPPTVSNMAAYLILKNESDLDIIITGAQSPNFAMAMIHDTVIENEIAKMQHRSELVIPAGGEVTLAPLGTHVMLIETKQTLSIGESAEITFFSKSGATLTAKIEVKQP